MSLSQKTFYTAAQIATAIGLKAPTVREQLRDVSPAGVRVVSGQKAAAWTLEQLPTALRDRLTAAATQQCCRTSETLLAMPREQWKPAIPLAEICEADIQAATKLREALKPWLVRQHDAGLSSSDLESQGVADYQRAFGHAVTPRYWRELFMRTIRRDNGAEEWNRLEIYLPDGAKRVALPTAVISEALAADFAELESFIAWCSNPHAPNAVECAGVWTLALEKFKSLVKAGESEKAAARRVRQYLSLRASFLATTRAALWVAWKRKLEVLHAANGDIKALGDRRVNNGQRVDIPQADINLLRHSAAIKNGGRINSAWRREYSRLSTITRARYDDPFTCPAKIYELVNRTIVDSLHAQHHGGKRAVRKLIGGLHGDRWEKIPSMHSWAMDDVTSNIEVVFENQDGSTTLLLPQIIAVMDSASRKWVGWAISADKAPNAALVCEAALDGFRKSHIPKQLWIENGYVFGKSLLVNGKEDDQGRTIVAGLAQYGCSVHHFGKMNPQAKAELERSFETIQRLMEEHPGYTGRHQMIDAPNEFKREQLLINRGKVEATKHRYTYKEFKSVVMPKLISEYNSTPQHGHLKGMSPNAAFTALADLNDPPIEYDPKLEWLFSNEKTIVTVGVGGVRFPHRSSGKTIRVRGGRLANPDLFGKELYAWVERDDSSVVTFMNLDFSDPFTMEVCQTPSARQESLAPESEVLESEISKIREHERAVGDEYKRLGEQFGNPRRDLLASIRNEPTSENSATISDNVRRVTILGGQLSKSAEQMKKQREMIHAGRKQKARQHGQAQRLADSTGIELTASGIGRLTPEQVKTLRDTVKGVLANGSAIPSAPKSLTSEGGSYIYNLAPSAGDKVKYVNYLIGQLTEFRKAGASFGQQFKGQVSFGVVKQLATRDMNCDLHDAARFEDVCQYLKGKINATILGKKNSANGVINYQDFNQPKEAL